MADKKNQDKSVTGDDPRRGLPSITTLLEDKSVRNQIEVHSRKQVLEALRHALSVWGKKVHTGAPVPTMEMIVKEAEGWLALEEMESTRPVVNATGVVLHTGLGRAPLPREASRAISSLHRNCNLELELDSGKRGSRHFMAEKLLCKITGAEAALIVNNNAAAIFLILKAFCLNKEVIVSRGQLIEIGGSFRLPDCLRESGAIMKEVGTTNKTHLRDYEKALSEGTGAVLRVFPSNYRIVGFSQAVSIAELETLKKKQEFLLVDDLGCGALLDMRCFGLPYEPTVQESIREGADLVCSSGDKLISGPQAGLIMGRKDLIARLKRHPMTRMLRVCKMTDVALEATLRLYLDPDRIRKRHPILRMMTMPASSIEKRAEALKKKLGRGLLSVRVVEETSAVGGGSMPDLMLKTYALAIKSDKLGAEKLCRLLRVNTPPIVARIRGNEVLIDMRTLLPGEDRLVFEAIRKTTLS